jgi:hypothetical protein
VKFGEISQNNFAVQVLQVGISWRAAKVKKEGWKRGKYPFWVICKFKLKFEIFFAIAIK